MKKLLMMAAIAALSSSAWAGMAYQVEINHIETGTAGLLPLKISLSLRDTSASPAGGKAEIWSDTVKFEQSNVKVGLNSGGYNSLSEADLINGGYIADGKLNVVKLLTEYKYAEFVTLQNKKVTLASDGTYGRQAIYEAEAADFKDSTEIFGSMPESEWAAYAEKNLKTVLSTDDDVRLNPVVTTLNKSGSGAGAGQLGANATLSQVVPEPTSGMLALLGVVGLMLRRRRAA